MSASSVAMDYDRGYADGYQDGVIHVLNQMSSVLGELSGAVMGLQEALASISDGLIEEQPNADIPTEV